MKDRELALIQELMEELQGQMEYDEDDLSERLGRKKPEVSAIKIEGELPLDEDESPEMDDEMDELDMEEADEQEDELEEEMSPENDLKKRLMKLRG